MLDITARTAVNIVEQLAGVAPSLCLETAENITGIACPVHDGWTAP